MRNAVARKGQVHVSNTRIFGDSLGENTILLDVRSEPPLCYIVQDQPAPQQDVHFLSGVAGSACVVLHNNSLEDSYHDIDRALAVAISAQAVSSPCRLLNIALHNKSSSNAQERFDSGCCGCCVP